MSEYGAEGPGTMPMSATHEGKPRDRSLDMLRGTAILLMALSGLIPFGKLPDWMYHMQVPPPAHKFDPTRIGMTWVDLVFPWFLFSMGAAMPFALEKRWQTHGPWASAALAVWRGALLVAFAIFDQHVRPYSLEKSPAPITLWISLGMFFVGLGMFGRFPWKAEPERARAFDWIVRAISFGIAALFLYHAFYPDGTGFRLERSDIILMVLAYCAAVGGLIWLVTRGKPAWRDATLLALVAWRVSATVPGTWANEAFTATWLPWLPRPEFSHYLIIVLLGMRAGEIVLMPPRSLADESRWGVAWSFPRVTALQASLAVSIIAVVWVYYSGLPRFFFLPTFLMLVLIKHPVSTEDRISAQLVSLGIACVAIGLLFGPFQGGLKKDPVTLSYMFTTSGLAAWAVAFFRRLPAKGFAEYLSLVGQNPMVAYLGITNLVTPLWGLTVGPYAASWPMDPWVRAGLGLVQTLLLGLVAAELTRVKIVMRT
ncbi:MAG: DUF5009 domain-containing protein [Fimbriimonadaceae bacterium]|nr:DUF5009 domain-containing protein [Fimbriimonadaceae bacterium]